MMAQDLSMYRVSDHMADYTLTLGNLIALGFDTDEKLHLDAASYPIWNEDYRRKLNEKIVAHYAMREIGSETPQMFVFYLGRTMRENMDYFNQLYESAAEKFDPFVTQDVTQTADTSNTSQSSGRQSATQDTKSSNTSTSDTTVDNSSMTVNSEFPQTRLDDFRKYATSASQTDSKGNTHSTSTQDSSGSSNSQSQTDFQHQDDKGSSTSHTSGFTGSRSQLLAEYRQTFLNIDMMVIQSLEPLFLSMWGSGDMMTNTPGMSPTSLAWNIGH